MHMEKGSNLSIHVLDQPNGLFRENIQKSSGFLSSAVCFHDRFISVSTQNLCPAIMETRISGDSGAFLRSSSLVSSQRSDTMSSLQPTLYLSILRFISFLFHTERNTPRKKETDLELLIVILALRNIMGTLMSRKSQFYQYSKYRNLIWPKEDVGITRKPMSHVPRLIF